MSSRLSNLKPVFKKQAVSLGKIPVYQYELGLEQALEARQLTADRALAMLEDMLMIREFESMIVKLRSGAYQPCAGFDYRGPTHVSIGQEATSVGACHGMAANDRITSTHRGHGDSIAKGCVAIRAMEQAELLARLGLQQAPGKLDELREMALEDHIFRTIAELFGKQEGYCKGRGGGMHIADFRVGHLGANAIVGGGVPIATGSAMSSRYLDDNLVTCCFAGDGAFANGVVLESLNWAAMGQYTNEYAGKRPFGLPVIFAMVNNHYGMTGRADGEVAGISQMARRGAGFADNNMNAEAINGMDILAVHEAVNRAAGGCRQGHGPWLLELDTYRFYGHSLSDPRNEYRTRDEEAAWKSVDPVTCFEEQCLEAGLLDREGMAELHNRVAGRNARAAARAAEAADPDPADVIRYMYTNTREDKIPGRFSKPPVASQPTIQREGESLSYKDAIKEALVEEMTRDARVIVYGEDVADYGGAFKVTKDLIDAFGRERVFNAPISEACICGTAVGAAMSGLRPVAELMYMDFTLMASDQIANQAAKWHYMSGASVELPLVYRVSVGGGKGYGGQHSQSLESVFAHIPGLYVMYPATPHDAKGMLKSAIRDNNPVMFVESQLLYNLRGEVPAGDYLVPPGLADIKRAGGDISLVTWGPALHDALKAAETLAGEGIGAEVIDLRSLIPLDMDTVLASVRKTGRCVVISQCVGIGSFTAEVASRVAAEAFDFLDAPVLRVGARDGIAPQSHVLEKAFLPDSDDIMAAARSIL